MHFSFGKTSVLFLSLTTVGLESCFDDKYDLSKDIDMNITVGGEALVVPLGYTEVITLDKVIDESETFKLGVDSIYAFKKKDKIDDVKIDVEAVNIDIDNPTIDSIEVDFEESTTIDPFHVTLDPTTFNVKAKTIEVKDDALPDVDLTISENLPSVPGFPINQTLTLTNHKEITLNLNAASFEDVEKVKAVYFGVPDANGKCYGQLVNFGIDLRAVNSLLEPGSKQSIEELKINFPEGFELAVMNDYNGTLSVNANVLTVRTAELTGQNSLNYQFYVKRIVRDFSVDNLKFNASLDFTLKYHINGRFKSGAPSGGEFVAGLTSDPFQFYKAAVVTKDVDVTVDSGEFNFTTEVGGLEDLKSVKKITFEEGTRLYLSLDQLVLPFDFHPTSVFVIEFPEIMRLSAGVLPNGISYNAVENRLIVPANALLQPGNNINLDLKEIDFTVGQQNDGRLVDEEGKIKLNETLRYYAASVVNGSASQGSLVVKGGKTLYTDELSGLERVMNIVPSCGTNNTGDVLVQNANVIANSVSSDVDTSTDFEVREEDMPEEVKSLKKVFLEGGKNARFVLHVDFAELPRDITKGINMDSLIVNLPKFIIFEDNEDIDENNVMTLCENFIPNEENHRIYTKTIEVKGLDFTKIEEYADKGILINENHVLEVPKEYTAVTVKGTVRTGDGEEVNSKNFKKFCIYPTIEVENMTIGKVVGKVDPVIDPVEEWVDLDLDDDLDFLKDENNELHIKNPMINVTLKSSVGVPVNLDMQISGYKDGSKQPIEGSEIFASTVQYPDFKLYPAIDCDTMYTHILISKLPVEMGQSTAEHKYVNLVLGNLSDLLVHLPDQVKFTLNAVADQTVDHEVDISPNMYNSKGEQIARFLVKGDYDVTVPLVFDEMHINYKDSIDNLNEDLWDFLDVAVSAEAEILADLVSTLPATLNLKASAADRMGNKLESIHAEVYVNDVKDGIIPGVAVEGASVTVPVKIVLMAKNAEELKRLDRLMLNVGGDINETVNGLPLKGNQSIQFVHVKACVKKVNLDLN